MNNNITDKLVYQIASAIYSFFITNVYFMLVISPFIFVFYFAEFTIQNILLYYITLLPFGPAYSALLKTMDKLVIDKLIAPTKDFWRFFRQNFKQALLYWFVKSTIILILLVDIYYASLFAPFLQYVFFILLFFMVLIMIYAFPILTRFEVGLKSLFVVSVYSVFRFVKVSLLNVTTVIAFGIIFYQFPSFISLFLMSLISFFMMYNLQGPLNLLRENFQKNETSQKDKQVKK